jgi:hypothetical protein
MNLYYKGKEVTPDLYAVEYINTNGEDSKTITQFFSGFYGYQKAVIWAHENFITGKIIYCLSLQWQNIIDGFPVKRGVKKKHTRTDFINASFTPQEIHPPVNMEKIV